MNKTLIRLACVVVAVAVLAGSRTAIAQQTYKDTQGATVRSFNGLLVAPRAMDIFRSLFYLEPRAGDWLRRLDNPLNFPAVGSCAFTLDPFNEPPPTIEWSLDWQLLAFPCAGTVSACPRPTVLKTGRLRARLDPGERVTLPSPDDDIVANVPNGCCLAMQVTGRPVAGPLVERLALSCGTEFLVPHPSDQ